MTHPNQQKLHGTYSDGFKKQLIQLYLNVEIKCDII